MSPEAIIALVGGIPGGTALVMLALFISGQIFSKKSYDDMKEQRDEWRRLYELQQQKAEAGLLAGRIVAEALRPALPGQPKELG